jgi:DNA-binding NarL/FixJ family response regulator
MAASRLRALLVDDHVLLAVGLQMLLEQLGHEVVEVVVSGEEAIQSAEHHRPNFVVMDVELEGAMDGVEAATIIYERLGIRSIFFTGHSDPETRERARAAEPLAFLDKSSSKADLAAAISTIAAGEIALK